MIGAVLKSVCLRLWKAHLCLHGCDACSMLGYVLQFFHGCCAHAYKLQHCISSDPASMSLYVLQGCGALSCGNWCQMFWDWNMVVAPHHQAPFTLWPCSTSQQNNIVNFTAVKASETHSSDTVPLYLEFPLVCYCMVVLLVYLLTKLSRLQTGLLT